MPDERLAELEAALVTARGALSIADTALAVATGMIPDEDWDEDMEGSKAQWIARVLRQMDSALKDGPAELEAALEVGRGSGLEEAAALAKARWGDAKAEAILALAAKPVERRYTLKEVELAWGHDDESWYEFSDALTGNEP